MSAKRDQWRSTRNLQEMTVNKLRFGRLGLYGRDDQVEKLRQCFEKSRESRQLLILEGQAGTGKSSLASQLRRIVSNSAGFYIGGKFDLQKRDAPYSAVAEACLELVEALLSIVDDKDGARSHVDVHLMSRKWTFTPDQVKAKLLEELGDDSSVLSDVIPCLSQVLSGRPALFDLSHKEAKNRFHYIFRKFVRTIGSFGPLCLVMDDLHWADPASLELMDVLLTDAENPSILVVCCYRSEEIDGTFAVSQVLHSLTVYAVTADHFAINKVTLGNLPVEHVHQMVKDVLSSDDERRTKDLAECVYNKTLGNPFFVIQFLCSLTEKELLSFNFGLLKWTWDMVEIKAQESVTANAVELVLARLQNLSVGHRHFLPLLASLGATFSYDNAAILVKEFGGSYFTAEGARDAPGLLKRCTDEGLLEEVSRAGEALFYKWVHDKIQEAALMLADPRELSSMQFSLGEVLLKSRSIPDLGSDIYPTVNLLLPGLNSLEVDDTRRVVIAELALLAGTNAFDASAFQQAVWYFSGGVKCLPPSRWTKHYKLSLDLHSSLAEACYCIGDFESMRKKL